MINFHGIIGIDDEGHILYVSNIVGEPYIRGTEIITTGLQNLHGFFENTV